MTNLTWQEREKGEVVKSFSNLVESWNEDDLVQCVDYSVTKHTEIYNMKVNNDLFSFRRVGKKYCIIYQDQSEFIQKETFDFFSNACKDFIKDSK